MMRALWTAASGMTSQQMNVDVISNNLSNVNTTAYKKDRIEFKDLVYTKLDKAYNLDDGKPVGLQVGLGTKPGDTLKNFKKGDLSFTENDTDFAIEGDGFFALKDQKGDIVYTKDGSFNLSPSDNGLMLVNSQGFPVLDSSEASIILEMEGTDEFEVDKNGQIFILYEDGSTIDTGIKIGIVKFQNAPGLESIGNNNYQKTIASGDPIFEQEEDANKSDILQGYLEGSNVAVVDEMVNLIVAQRAYEINSKIIQAADDMLGQANNLRS